MRRKSLNTSGWVAVCAVAAFLVGSLPALAIGGTCSPCYPNYLSCMENAMGDGTVTSFEEQLCGTLLAGCFSNCQAMQYMYCTYTYDFYLSSCEGSGCCTPTGWYDDQSWQTNLEASGCTNYMQSGSTLSCQPWP